MRILFSSSTVLLQRVGAGVPSSLNFRSISGGYRRLFSDIGMRGAETAEPPPKNDPPKGTAFDGTPQRSGTSTFGYREVPEDMKASLVSDVFSRVADKYDLMNDLMSGGTHRLWKNAFVSAIDAPLMKSEASADEGISFTDSSDEQTAPRRSDVRIVDVAGGTGDIAFRIVDSARERHKSSPGSVMPRVTVCDINESMIEVGRKRAASEGYDEVEWVVGDGENLPFADGTADIVTIAFGIRNFTHMEKGLAEAHRILKNGGRFLCLEFSKVENPVMRQLYDLYSFYVIPSIGSLVMGKSQPYQYLVESIRQFPSQEEFAEKISAAGFENVSYSSMTFGVVSIHSGYKLNLRAETSNQGEQAKTPA